MIHEMSSQSSSLSWKFCVAEIIVVVGSHEKLHEYTKMHFWSNNVQSMWKDFSSLIGRKIANVTTSH